MKKIPIGVIGCGYWGPNLIRNFQRIENAELTWICDKDTSRMEKVAHDFQLKSNITTDYNELLEDPKVKAVVIATPVTTHFELAEKSLKAGKHTLVEKPLTRTVEQSKRLVEISKEQNCILMVDHTFMFSSPVIELKQILGNGELGEILYVHSMRVNLGIFQEDISVLWDLLPHDLSIIDYLLDGLPLEVSAQGATHFDSQFENVAFVTIYYENNLMANFHLSWLDPCKVRRMTIVGDRKMAVFDDTDPNEPIRIYDKRISKLPYYSDFGEFKSHSRFGDIYSPRIEIVEPLKQVCSHFLHCIEKRTVPDSDGEAGMRIVKIIEAAEKSIKHRGRIEKIDLC